MIPENRKKDYLVKIKNRVEELMAVPDIGLRSSKYTSVVSRAMYYELALLSTPFSLSIIAKNVNRDHSTVIYSKGQLPQYLRKSMFQQIYDELCIEFNIATKDQMNRKILSNQQLMIRDTLNSFSDNSSYDELFNLIKTIPEDHLETVKMRLEPIIKMLRV